MTTHPLDPLLALSIDEAGLHAMCRVVAASAGEDFDQLGEFTQETIRATQRQCIEAYLRAANARGDGLIAAIEFALADAVNGQIREAGFNRLRAALTTPGSEVQS